MDSQQSWFRMLNEPQTPGPVTSICIVILNWNGWKDTLDCLTSIFQSNHAEFCCVVVDNGSTDDSINQIQRWAAARLEPTDWTLLRHPEPVPLDRRLILVESPENLGFAGGCNLGIRAAILGGAEFIWLLNNDTGIRPDCLYNLVSFLLRHPAISAVTPKIHTTDNRIWNCGGQLTWYGGRTYDLSNQPLDTAPDSGWKPVSFMTGCAALFRTSLFTEHGLLSERFFFGEEDIEFCRRVRKQGIHLACVYDAVITHKVSQSTERIHGSRGLGRIYVYYVNRLVAMRQEWPLPVWWTWRLLYAVYIAWIVRRHYRITVAVVIRFLQRLAVDSTRLQGVSRDDFQKMIRLTFD